MAFTPDMLLPLAGYVCGAIPFGVLIARAKGVDPFKAGSGNIGATNVGRVLGKPLGISVFLCDFLKGLAPTYVALWLRGGADWIAALTGLAAILGHMFSPFLGFRGGKGVATGAGVFSVLLPIPAGLAVIAFVSTILASCTMSLASIVAAVVLAMTQLSLTRGSEDLAAALFVGLVAGLVIWRHHANVSRLIAGTESKIASLRRWSPVAPGLHALALGLWCGAAWFFSLAVAPAIFAAMKDLGAKPPEWLHVSPMPSELGSRLGGVAVAPLFPCYFTLQSICGAIAAGTAIGWMVTRPGRSTRWRAITLMAAMILVAIGWPVSRYVSDLRIARFDNEPARAAFATWHLVSLMLNLAVLALLAPAMIMAGYVRPQSTQFAGKV